MDTTNQPTAARGDIKTNRHERRRLASLQRRQDRALRRILSGTDLPASGMTQLLILRLAYRAWHLGRLTRRQARSLGCVV